METKTNSLDKFKQPIVVSDVDLAFGGTHVNEMMPSYDDIPEDFKRHHGKWCDIVSKWFFNGLPPKTEFIPADGVDPRQALRHIGTVMGSFQPKHEHKTAACAYLFSRWFKDVILP